MRRKAYQAVISDIQPDRQQREAIRRRVEAFLDYPGFDRPLIDLLGEAYLQGLRDATEIIYGIQRKSFPGETR